MDYKYRRETSVKPLLKWIDWEHTWRNNLMTGESQKHLFGFGGDSTWDKNKIDRCKENYINRIKQGKVKIFYVDLVEHTMNEMENKIKKGPSTIVYDVPNRIFKVNRFYRLCAYYEAISELAPSYLSTNK